VLADANVDPTGTLRYTLTGVPGRAEISVTAVDDGGTEHGGNDRGTPQRRVIQAATGIDLSVVVRRIHPATGALLDAPGMAAWAVTVANHGPVDATYARVRMLRQHGLLDVLWSCVAPATCAPTDGAGAMDAQFGLAVGASLTAEVSGEVDFSQPFVELWAQVSPPAGMSPAPGSDDIDVLIEPAGVHGVYKDGFD
jgi:hypothetical protein